MRVTHNSLTTDKPVALKFPIELEFRNVDFCGGRKTGEPGEKPSEQGRKQTTNSTHLWHWVQDLNPGHIGVRRALSRLRHPCSSDKKSLNHWSTHTRDIIIVNCVHNADFTISSHVIRYSFNLPFMMCSCQIKIPNVICLTNVCYYQWLFINPEILIDVFVNPSFVFLCQEKKYLKPRFFSM